MNITQADIEAVEGFIVEMQDNLASAIESLSQTGSITDGAKCTIMNNVYGYGASCIDRVGKKLEENRSVEDLFVKKNKEASAEYWKGYADGIERAFKFRLNEAIGRNEREETERNCGERS